MAATNRSSRQSPAGKAQGVAVRPAGRRVREKRIGEDQYYLNIAREVAGRSTCLRRKFGAVIVKNKQILSTGYCGAPRGTINCCDVGSCLREELGAKKGEHYEWCRSVHGEANAIIHAARLDMIDSTMYLVGLDAWTDALVSDAEPCRMCKRLIINAGISRVIIQAGPRRIRRIDVRSWVKNNLGEFRSEGGRLVPVRRVGY
ncbi:MAG: dCMP deaminase family protein [Vicinamibacteria bacterium]|nr:dCMP deaminase family protein [Vicinamibacteria bacterium]